ncbi:DUF2922 domain-containing protein [Desulfallas thermosapovorans]|uniref:DUF2922 family protein n=1 Tax=Desulfallas thermosapovorans DSM 6562 TaxID=1121431 RepID=A0A5S4ZN07_9FIRM|nr:DUF2922 domain-containing protein [Desulfallas thermosapovorans]TYO92799.1 Protein of unknown function (DUF2922) [Desulfallas thermosapovorans DSM 6562]
MAKYLEMLFRNQAGQLVTISVIDPRPDITPGEVEAVMDTIIAQNIFTSPGGDLVAKVQARVIERSYTWYNVS